MAILELADGRKLYYVDEGEGQTFVFVHGWAGDSDVYIPICDALKDRYRCIRFDLWGHRRSGGHPQKSPELKDLARDLNDLMEALNVKKPILAGWSMGALTVLEYARRFGERKLKGIVLVDMAPCLLNDADWKLGAQGGELTKERFEAALPEYQAHFSEFLKGFFRRAKPSLPEASILQIVRDKTEHYDTRALLSLYESMIRADERPLLPRLKKPVAIFGADHGLFRPETWDYYVEAVRAPLMKVVFEDASHELIREYPEKFTKAFESFAVFMGSFQPDERKLL